MKFTGPYTTFDKAMRYFRMQASSSVPEASIDYPLGSFVTARELWDDLKPRVTYRDDPDDVELFQSYYTLFYENHHGRSGAGDCDCFALSTVAICKSLQLDCKIVLAGRSKKYPVHIYNIVEGVIFDLTQPKLGLVKFYPYIQTLNIKV